MKSILLLMSLLFSFQMYLGQNALFIPFGQSSSDIQTQFREKNYIKRTSVDEELIESKVGFKRNMRYHLFFDRLYSIEDQRMYVDKKEAEKVIQSCIAYMEFDNRKAYVLSNKGGTTHYAAIHTDRVIEFVVKKKRLRRKRYEFTLTLKTTSRFHGPRNKTEAFAQSVIEKFD